MAIIAVLCRLSKSDQNFAYKGLRMATKVINSIALGAIAVAALHHEFGPRLFVLRYRTEKTGRVTTNVARVWYPQVFTPNLVQKIEAEVGGKVIVETIKKT